MTGRNNSAYPFCKWHVQGMLCLLLSLSSWSFVATCRIRKFTKNLRRCGTKASMILLHFPAVFTKFAYFSTGFHSTSSCIHSTFSFHSLKIATRFNPFPNPGGGGGGPRSVNTTIIYNSYILQRSLFPGFLHLDLVSSAYHDISCIFPFHFPMVLMQFPMIFLSSVLRRFPAFSHVSALISSAYHDFSCIFAIFSIVSCIFLCFCSHFLCLPWYFLHVHNIFLRCTLFSHIFPCFCSHFLCLP